MLFLSIQTFLFYARFNANTLNYHTALLIHLLHIILAIIGERSVQIKLDKCHLTIIDVIQFQF